MRFQSFGSHEEMMAEIARTREEALKSTKPWQAALKPGDKVLVLDPEMPIFQEVLAPDADEDIHPAYMLVRGHSTACPEGEVGSACRCNAAAKLTPGEWRAFEKAGWVIDETTWGLVPDLEERIKRNMTEEA